MQADCSFGPAPFSCVRWSGSSFARGSCMFSHYHFQCNVGTTPCMASLQRRALACDFCHALSWCGSSWLVGVVKETSSPDCTGCHCIHSSTSSLGPTWPHVLSRLVIIRVRDTVAQRNGNVSSRTFTICRLAFRFAIPARQRQRESSDGKPTLKRSTLQGNFNFIQLEKNGKRKASGRTWNSGGAI